MFKTKEESILMIDILKTVVKEYNEHNHQREELPAYLRAYKSDQLITGHGNSITSNVHPMSTVTHPSWREFSNGIQCTVHLCKRCVTKLEKQYKLAEETLIKSDGSIIERTKDIHSLRYNAAF